MDKKVATALINTLERFEKGHWMSGRWSDGRGNFCLLGSLEHELGITRGRRNDKALCEALGQLGFVGWSAYSQAYAYNDMAGRSAVIDLLRRVLKVEPPEHRFTRLHFALDASRIAHAQRDIGKKVPDFAPAAWEEMNKEVMHPEFMKV